MNKLSGPSNNPSKKKGIPLKGGGSGMMHGTAQAGKQSPGQTGQKAGGSNKSFKADAGAKGGMFGKQSVTAQKPGGTGKSGGGGGGGGGGGKKRGYGGDAGGNPY